MVKLGLPSVSSAADLLPALDSITAAVGQGLITPEEGQHIAAIFAQTQRVLELVELEQRLSRLEARHE